MSKIFNKKVIKKMIDDHDIVDVDLRSDNTIHVIFKKKAEKKENNNYV